MFVISVDGDLMLILLFYVLIFVVICLSVMFGGLLVLIDI